jgi:phospholipid/cholesterol/gamma-HCH transport system ATP-binding protein
VVAAGRVQAIGSMTELSQVDNPAVRQFFDGPRGRAAQQQGAAAKGRSSKPR